jgi:hypothetical protein
MRGEKRHGPEKERRRGAEPEEIGLDRGEAPDQSEQDPDPQTLDDKDHTVFKDDRRERRRDRHE